MFQNFQIVNNNFNLSFPQKQLCYDIMLEIDSKLMRDLKW
jgi:hypothetical protein